jgi:hypothetical protein
VAALEAAALSPEYGGRRLTKKQLNELKLSAQEKHKKIFDRLEAMIVALPSKLQTVCALLFCLSTSKGLLPNMDRLS